MIEEKDILNYLDGNSTTELRARVETWMSQDPSNGVEFEFTKMMWKESCAASDYVKFDVSKEWEVFEEKVSKKKTLAEEGVEMETSVLFSERVSWRTNFSIFASVAAFIFASWWLWPQEDYINIVDAPNDMEVVFDDGSTARVKEGATLRTKRVYKYETQRNVEMEGEVIFDVAEELSKPFIVKTRESAVEVLGTIFSVKTEGRESEVANQEGLIKFFVIEDPDQFVILEEGQVFRYDGYGFVDLNKPEVKPEPEPEPEPESESEPEPEPEPVPKIGDILTYLRQNFGGRVTFQSGINDHISKELDIDYEGKSVREIIRLMQEKAFVIYLDKGCKSCVEFVEIIPKKIKLGVQ